MHTAVQDAVTAAGLLLVDEVNLDHVIIEHIAFLRHLRLVSLLLHPLLVQSLFEELPHCFLFNAVSLMGSFPRRWITTLIFHHAQVIGIVGLELALLVSIDHGFLSL